jgi:hypothetical protein
VLGHEQRDLALHFARRGREKFDVDLDWRTDPKPPGPGGAEVWKSLHGEWF